ncbi:MAG: nucleoside diphosphate kinase regulator [Verrucomicrobia bacterium]|jgi:regulator of nucleoside diphosphate kinase|nr:nucleoside diphosphate kinase regulator [Verrucomicrobiota bacterium]OQC66754.1 MAG: Regulator of nucleoside diphosphate kinase [Verrucomicrobia bacterium ADurb.Bin006]MDI9381587.1 nucleoside diphosphate kinase regulator [Verrucomicrobiota bacterium]NMD20843.1 nucleoside diphosphate kinase regulator [Verrucomicrobiota bacterium]HNU98349.1 nucleoside diphosphate kinase regulator [Verrucomicrobiota bacterium]
MSDDRTIYVTTADMARLQALLARQKNAGEALEKLAAELDRARVVAPEDIPQDIITMNSTAQLRELLTDDVMTYTLVFPDRADYEAGRISVLAPIGTAMLGQREGDEFEWEVPAGPVRLRVEKVIYQPEAAGRSDP